MPDPDKYIPEAGVACGTVPRKLLEEKVGAFEGGTGCRGIPEATLGVPEATLGTASLLLGAA